MIKWTRLSHSSFAYCKQSKTEQWGRPGNEATQYPPLCRRDLSFVQCRRQAGWSAIPPGERPDPTLGSMPRQLWRWCADQCSVDSHLTQWQRRSVYCHRGRLLDDGGVNEWTPEIEINRCDSYNFYKLGKIYAVILFSACLKHDSTHLLTAIVQQFKPEENSIWLSPWLTETAVT